MVLVIFCTLFISGSIIIIASSLQKKRAVISIEPIRFMHLKDLKRNTRPVGGDELRKILRFKHYLDSNKIFRDSLLARRPHMMDSIKLIEKIYQNK